MLTRLSPFLLSVVLLSLSVAQAQPTKPSLRERAAAGDVEAQFNLAKMYEAGRGGLKQDYVEAERWHRRAAEQGDPFAQASLGILLRFGKGVAQDDIEAYKWLYLAAAQTSGGERESIKELLDSTAARMTPKEIAEATRLAREWKLKPAQQH